MYKNKATGFYEHDFRVSGVGRYHLSYGVTRKADAERLHGVAVALFRAKELPVIAALRSGVITLEQIAQSREKGEPFAAVLASTTAAKPWPTLQDAVTAYVSGIEANTNRSAGTARAAQTQLRKAVTALGPDTRLDQITTEAVTAYQTALRAEGLAVNTVTAYVWRIGTLYRWHIRREAIAAREGKRPVRELHVPLDLEVVSTDKTARGRYLTESEAADLLTVTPARLRVLVALGLFAGLRVDEACHLRTGLDVNLDTGVLSVQKHDTWKPKTKRSVRHVAISSALRPILTAHLDRFANESWLSPSLDDDDKPFNRHTLDEHFGRIVQDAGLVKGRADAQGVTFHTLRHTFASWLIMGGTDLFTVAQLLGNTVAQIEKTYGHLSQDHRLAAVNRLAESFPLPALD